ncbi:hypothetical protein CDAR_40371 [Caerostris darwini]|uniref:Uncharacterized protein n=1 Tax=Caerostris darwini TaxID=1538125 RepID=A0AAV4R9Q1_9ARAC|nr:hypothetical protein CDAR_40371 [Caerostris darwini]
MNLDLEFIFQGHHPPHSSSACIQSMEMKGTLTLQIPLRRRINSGPENDKFDCGRGRGGRKGVGGGSKKRIETRRRERRSTPPGNKGDVIERICERFSGGGWKLICMQWPDDKDIPLHANQQTRRSLCSLPARLVFLGIRRTCLGIVNVQIKTQYQTVDDCGGR